MAAYVLMEVLLMQNIVEHFDDDREQNMTGEHFSISFVLISP